MVFLEILLIIPESFLNDLLIIEVIVRELHCVNEERRSLLVFRKPHYVSVEVYLMAIDIVAHELLDFRNVCFVADKLELFSRRRRRVGVV